MSVKGLTKGYGRDQKNFFQREFHLQGRDGRAGLFCHRAGLGRAGLIFLEPGWAGAGWARLATAHKNWAAGFFPCIS